MILLDVSLFVGKFHPLLVHLPIGFLILAALLQWMGSFSRYEKIRVAVPVSLLVGCIAAFFSCVTGYLLSLEGGYNNNTLDQHMWMGIITTATALIAWLISIKIVPIPVFQSAKLLNVSLLLILFFITLAGHWGGTLTHGEGYLAFESGSGGKQTRKQITDINEAQVFSDIVQPILQHKCGDCHNNNKMKGELSLQSFNEIIKGGKHGEVVVGGKPQESELIKRVMLDPSDKKFMPTDGKPPLTKNETAIITWWIETSLQKEDKTLAVAAPPENIRKLVEEYFGSAQTAAQPASSAVPLTAALNIAAPALKADALKNIEQAGFVIKQIHFNPDLLDVTLRSSDSGAVANRLSALKEIKDNIAWLNISGNAVNDESLTHISEYSNLQRLRVDNNPVTDKGVQQLAGLKNLQSINLCFTKVTPDALEIMAKMPALKTAYIWGTALPQKDSLLRKDSSLHIISGSQNVPK